MLMDFLVLIFAHLLADYPLQGEFLATMKGKNFVLLATHAGIWTGTVLTAAYLLGYAVTVFDVLILFVGHAIADYAKAKPIGIYKELDGLREGLLLDQSIHVLQIIGLLVTKM
ncbi:hypothetical protein BSNK01_12080 [Bacillaceae bacterium]